MLVYIRLLRLLTHAVLPPFLAHLILHLFRIGCQNFSSRSSKVRSPGQVKWPNLRENSSTSPCYIYWPIALKLSGFVRVTGYKKCISRIFDIYDLRSSQFCDLPIISQWEKFHFILVCVKTTISSQNMQNIVLVSHSSWQVHRWPLQWAVEVAWRHHMSPTVFSQ